MAKFFETAEDIMELANNKFEETGLSGVISLKVMSTTKSREILKIKKGSPETNFIAKNRADVCLIVFQEVFDRLSDEIKEKIMEGVFSNVSFDYDKEKINIDNSRYGEVIRMRSKYDNYVDFLETGYLTIQQLEDEERERKAMEKETKKNK